MGVWPWRDRTGPLRKGTTQAGLMSGSRRPEIECTGGSTELNPRDYGVAGVPTCGLDMSQHLYPRCAKPMCRTMNAFHWTACHPDFD